MKKLLAVLILGAVALGFYRGWFTLSSNTGDETNKVDVNLTLDPDKAKEDAEKLKDKTMELGERAKDEVKSEVK